MPRRKEVDDWFARYENPMKPVVQRMREIILAADDRIDECIKWQAPTFTFGGNLASFFPKSKQHASLMFHVGAKIPGNHPRLEGEAELGRSMKIASVADADEAKAELEAIVKAWCTWREADDEPAGAAAKKPTAKKAAKTAAKKAAKTAAKKAAKKPAANKATATRPAKRR